MRARILLLETDEGRGEILRGLLRNQECRARTPFRPEEAREQLAAGNWDAVFCDIRLSQALPSAPSPQGAPVILLAPYDEISRAQELVERGVALRWLPSPGRSGRVLATLQETMQARRKSQGR